MRSLLLGSPFVKEVNNLAGNVLEDQPQAINFLIDRIL
jgi:hypothetical protein